MSRYIYHVDILYIYVSAKGFAAAMRFDLGIVAFDSLERGKFMAKFSGHGTMSYTTDSHIRWGRTCESIDARTAQLAAEEFATLHSFLVGRAPLLIGERAMRPR